MAWFKQSQKRPPLLWQLLLAQGITAVGMSVVFGLLFYVERNLTVARLLAERWAPALLAVQWGQPQPLVALLPGQPAPAAPLHHLGAEAPANLPGFWGGPRVQTLRTSLAAAGVVVQDIALGAESQRATVWIGVNDPYGQRHWLGYADELVEPRLPLRAVLAVLSGALVVTVVSAAVARRLARPLEHLRSRIENHRPGVTPSASASASASATGSADGPNGAGSPPHPDQAPIQGATREIEAIDAAFQELLHRLERHESERALMLAGVSHDLRSPLARARMAADLLPESPGVTQRREAILRNIDVADRLIGSFMDHVRASSLPLDESVDLALLCRQVVAAQARGEQDGQPQLWLEAPERLQLPAANSLLLERVLRNLIDNAFVHGQAPVRVRLSADELVPEGQAVTGAGLIQGPAVLLEVADRGPGISPGEQARMMQAFARGDVSRNRPGTGLGLSVVDQVTTRLGGQVRMAHEDGWNRIQLWLPLNLPR